MTATSPTIGQYQASPTKVVRAATGVDYAYRDVGQGTPPLYCYSTSVAILTTGIPH